MHLKSFILRGAFAACLFGLLACAGGHAQTGSVGPGSPVPISLTAKGFASVLLHPMDGPTLLPHVPLGGSELEFRFDDLDAGYRTLGYRLVPCTWDWRREPRLTAADCIRGFPDL